MSQYTIRNTQYTALIVAGGSGSRMGSDIPKQFMLLKKKARADAYHRGFLLLRLKSPNYCGA